MNQTSYITSLPGHFLPYASTTILPLNQPIVLHDSSVNGEALPSISNYSGQDPFFNSPVTAPCKKMQYSRIGLQPYENWEGQVKRLHYLQSMGKAKYYSTDVCSLAKSCAFYLFFAAQSPANQRILLSHTLHENDMVNANWGIS